MASRGDWYHGSALEHVSDMMRLRVVERNGERITPEHGELRSHSSLILEWDDVPQRAAGPAPGERGVSLRLVLHVLVCQAVTSPCP